MIVSRNCCRCEGIRIFKELRVQGERLIDHYWYYTNLILLCPTYSCPRFHWSVKIIGNVPEARVWTKTLPQLVVSDVETTPPNTGICQVQFSGRSSLAVICLLPTSDQSHLDLYLPTICKLKCRVQNRGSNPCDRDCYLGFFAVVLHLHRRNVLRTPKPQRHSSCAKQFS